MFSGQEPVDHAGGRVVRLRQGRSGGSASTTSTSSTPSSGPGSSRSAPTSRIRPRCGSTVTSGPNAKPTRPGSATRRWPTGSPPATTPTGCRRSATGSGPPTCRGSSTAGSRSIPTPFTAADRAAGYWWELSMRQVEVSRTLVFDDPRRARGFFEALVADNIGIGRPDEVARRVRPRPPRAHHRQARSAPGSSAPAPRSRSTSPTSTAGSSNTSRKGERCASRPSSTSHPTSACLARLEHLPELVAKARAGQRSSAYDRTCRSGLCHRLCALRAHPPALHTGGPTNRSLALRGSTRHGPDRRPVLCRPRRHRLHQQQPSRARRRTPRHATTPPTR